MSCSSHSDIARPPIAGKVSLRNMPARRPGNIRGTLSRLDQARSKVGLLRGWRFVESAEDELDGISDKWGEMFRREWVSMFEKRWHWRG